MGRLRAFLRSAFNLESDSATYEEIHRTIVGGANIKGTNLFVLVLAIFIASIGLNMNSTAVIIGAMLISPLMGGIMAVGYGFAINDLQLSRKAFTGLLFQVVVCIVTSALYFSLSPISTAHSELLARTTPTIWDVLIAVFGGLAGIIGVTRREKTNVLPGVAIATALMPPLCTAGYGLATRSLTFFLGAMYLFFINSFFICVSTFIIVRFLHVPRREFIDRKTQRRVKITIYAIAVVTVLPSIYLGYQIVNKSVQDSNIQRFISQECVFDNAQVVRSSADPDKKEIQLALLGKRQSDDVIEKLNLSLKNYNLEGMTLRVTQTELNEGIDYEDVQALIEKELEQNSQQANILSREQELENLKAELVQCKAQLMEYQRYDFDAEGIARELKALYPQVWGCAIGRQKKYDETVGESRYAIAVNLDTAQALTPEEKGRITDWLTAKIGEGTLLVYEHVSSPPAGDGAAPQPEQP